MDYVEQELKKKKLNKRRIIISVIVITIILILTFIIMPHYFPSISQKLNTIPIGADIFKKIKAFDLQDINILPDESVDTPKEIIPIENLPHSVTILSSDPTSKLCKIDSITGDEDKLFTAQVLNNQLILTPKFTGTQKIDGKDLTQPSSLNVKIASSTDILDNQLATPITKTIDGTFTYDLDCSNGQVYKFGDHSIILSGLVTYSSINRNITDEGGIVHLNISNTAPYGNLLAYYNFDMNNNATVYDLSNNSNDGVLLGTTNINVTNCLANYGKCLQINVSGQGINISNSNSFNFSKAFSISFWYNPNSFTAEDGIIMKTGNTTFLDGWGIIVGSGNKTNFFINNRTQNTSNSSVLYPNNWYHLVVVYNGTGLSTYTNGTLTGATLQSNAVINNGQRLIIGSTNGLGTASMDGILDEVMIFNSSLTNQQITDIYNNQSMRFANNGSQLFQNINLQNGTSLINITITNPLINFSSNVTAILSSGTTKGQEIPFSMNSLGQAVLNNYDVSGLTNLNNANLTLMYYPSGSNYSNSSVNSTSVTGTLDASSRTQHIYLDDNIVNGKGNYSVTYSLTVGDIDVYLNGIAVANLTTLSLSPLTFNNTALKRGFNNITFIPELVSSYTITQSNLSYLGYKDFYSPIIAGNIYIDIPNSTSLSSCANLTRPNTVYTVINNLLSDSNCIIVLANNITINGNNQSITFSRVSFGYGINVTGFNNTVITNFSSINVGNLSALASMNNVFNIALFNATNTTISSIGNITQGFGTSAHGIVVNISNFTNVNNVSFSRLAGTNVATAGLRIQSSSFGNYSNINVSGTFATDIHIDTTSIRNNFNNIKIDRSVAGTSSISMGGDFNNVSNYNYSINVATDALTVSGNNNNINNVSGTATGQAGFITVTGQFNSFNNLIYFYNVLSSATAIDTANSNNNNFTNFNITSYATLTVSIIGFGSSHNNSFSNGVINANGSSIFAIAGATPNVVNITNVSINTGGNRKTGLSNTVSLSNITLTDMPDLADYNFTQGVIRFNVIKTNLGEILFTSNVTGNGTNFTKNVLIGNNTVSINFTDNGGLNVSSNITLYGIGNRGFVTPVILFNNTLACTSSTTPSCSNATSLTADIVKFNISNWGTGLYGNFSIGTDIIFPQINFTMPPTNANGTSLSSGNNATINISILNITTINGLIYNWNGTNYSIFNGSVFAYYNLDNVTALGEDSTRVVDISGNGKNGTVLNGALVNTTNCKYGNCYTFDGINDKINMTPITSGIADNFTFAVWVYPTQNNQSYKPIVISEATGYNNLWAAVATFDSKWDFELFNNAQNPIVRSVNNYTLNKWTYVVGTVRYGGNITLYVDGVKVNSTSDTVLAPPAISGFYIGGGQNVANRFFKGSLDEVTLYNRTLSDADVQQLYMTNLYKYTPNQWVLYVNQSNDSSTSLVNGIYSYYGFVQSSDGQINITDTRYLTIGAGADTIPPSIQFTTPPTPANGTNITYGMNITANVSVFNAGDLAFVNWEWNLTNYTIYDQNVVLWMNFDNLSAIGENDNKTVDISRYGNNGTVVGATPTSNGKYNGAYSFNGVDNNIDVADSPSLDINGSMTVSMWVNFTDLGGEMNLIQKLTNVGAPEDNGWLLTKILDNELVFSVQFNDTRDDLIGDPSFVAGNWYNIVVIWSKEDGKLYMYKDGVLLNSSVSSHSLQNFSTEPLRIGARAQAAQDFYVNGTIDEVIVLNRSLNKTEVEEMYMSNFYKFSATQWAFYINQSQNATSPLNPSSYDYQACARDFSNNQNCSDRQTNIIIDTTAPVFLNLTNRTVFFNNTFSYDINATDNVGVAFFNLNDTYSGTFNINMTSGLVTNTSALVVQIYWFNVSVNDSTGNTAYAIWFVNSTSPSDTIFPNLTYVSPTEASGVNRKQSFIVQNVTATDNVNISLITLRIFNSSGQLVFTNTSSSSPFFWNKTGLADGLYFYNASANDTNNNINNTLTRNITLDTRPPFFTGSNSVSLFTNQTLSAQINATDAGVGLSGYSINWTSIFSINFVTGVITNTSAIFQGTYNINVTANDTLDNRNTTIFNVIITNSSIPDTTAPIIIAQNFTQAGNLSFSQTINATDANGVFFTLNNTNVFNINFTTGLITNITNLSTAQIFWLNLSVNDSSNNKASIVFFINITSVPAPGVTQCNQNFTYIRIPIIDNGGPYVQLCHQLDFTIV